MNLDLDLDAIRQRAEAATTGPWWFDEDDNCWRLHGVHARLPVTLGGVRIDQVINHQILKAPKRGTTYAEYWPNAADAAFIAAAREDIPALLAEVERLRDQLATASRRVRHIAEHGDPHTAHALALIADELAVTVHPSPVGDLTPAARPGRRARGAVSTEQPARPVPAVAMRGQIPTRYLRVIHDWAEQISLYQESIGNRRVADHALWMHAVTDPEWQDGTCGGLTADEAANGMWPECGQQAAHGPHDQPQDDDSAAARVMAVLALLVREATE